MIELDWENFSVYVKTHSEGLIKVDGSCEGCPLRKACEDAKHEERIHAILSTPPEQTTHPILIRLLKGMPFLLYLIPRRIYRMWSGYDNDTLGCPSMQILPHLSSHKKVYELLTDADSRRTYLAALMFRLTFDNDYLKAVVSDGKEYFECFHNLGSEEVVIDCGAYTGDTLQDYLSCNEVPRQYVLFEPDRANVEQLRKNIKEMHAEAYTVVHEKGVGETTKTLYLTEENGMASKLSEQKAETSYTVDIISIDSLQIEDVSFIKMDIEGAEKAALTGARSTIQRYAPKLAICLYHSPLDLWEVPLLIRDMVPSYQSFIVRHYHKYSFTETILYVW